MPEETQNSENDSADADTLAFLALVDCRPDEVQDIPTGRRFVRHSGFDEHNIRSLGNKELWFGKHKGTKFKDAPDDYLLWLLSAPDLDNRTVRKSKREITEYIKLRLKGGPR